METILPHSNYRPLKLLFIFAFTGIFGILNANDFQQFREYKGEVVDIGSGDEIASAYIVLEGTNISSITNSDGEFSLKIPINLTEGTITISHLGFQSKTLPLSYFQPEGTRVELQETAEALTQITVYDGGDAVNLVTKMFEKRGANYIDDHALMTAFYRETIKKRRRNVSLSEAVVKIHKYPIGSDQDDDIALYKARKSTDYERLDTLALKLRGGPYNALYIDVIKYPQFLMEPDQLSEYSFSFDEPTRLDNKNLFVVNFEEKNKNNPWYYGKLYIDSKTHGLVKATYKLNVDDRIKASQMFVKKKPRGASVYPIDVTYQIDYREKDGKWFYGYGNANLEFVVNWDNKLFNSRYTINGEMAVTDWDAFSREEFKAQNKFISPSIVMVDDVSGFADVDFWGNNNIIEPEKSIQNAIDKIQRQLSKKDN